MQWQRQDFETGGLKPQLYVEVWVPYIPILPLLSRHSLPSSRPSLFLSLSSSLLPYSKPFLSLPFSPLPLITLGLGSAIAPSGSGRSPAAKRIWVQFTAQNLQIYYSFINVHKTSMQHFGERFAVLSPVRLSSVIFASPTQPVEIFGSVSSPRILAIR